GEQGLRRADGDRQADRRAQAEGDGRRDRYADGRAGEVPRLLGDRVALVPASSAAGSFPFNRRPPLRAAMMRNIVMATTFDTAQTVLFSSEPATQGHPYITCDQTYDAVFDAALSEDLASRVAREPSATRGFVFFLGEITTTTYIDIQ